MAIKSQVYQATAAVKNPLSNAPVASNSNNTALNPARKAKGPPTVAVVKPNRV